jgi:hypothetical protein
VQKRRRQRRRGGAAGSGRSRDTGKLRNGSLPWIARDESGARARAAHRGHDRYLAAVVTASGVSVGADVRHSLEHLVHHQRIDIATRGMQERPRETPDDFKAQ